MPNMDPLKRFLKMNCIKTPNKVVWVRGVHKDWNPVAAGTQI